ncbi:MAG: YfhO family protein [Bacteroidota bacterium]
MNTSSLFQKAIPHVVAVIVFLSVSVIYFSPQLQGKIVRAGDTVSYKAMSKEMRDFKKNTGENTLWTNAMFGGMPTYQIGSVQPTNAFQYVEKSTHLYIPRPIGYFVGMMVGFYILMILLGVNAWLSMIGAIAFSLSTNNLVLFGAGHMSKIRTFAYFGFIFAGIVLAFRKKHLLGGILFAFGLGVNIYSNHIQMTFYLFMALGVYGLIELVQHAQRGELPAFGKAVLYLTVGGLFAIAANASGLWTTYEYSKDTMRGTPILEKEANVEETSSNTDGLDFKYAMQYSNGWLDLVSSFIPGVVGGGGGEPVGNDSKVVQDLKRQGRSLGPNPRLPLYWGAVGKSVSTAGPVYFGAVMFFLFILGLFVVKGSIKWGLAAGVLLTMLLSLGDNFAGFNRFIFDYFPLYNKFRTPNSILAITSFFVPILGTLAVWQYLKNKTSKADLLKSLYAATGIMAGLCLFFAFLGGSFFEFTNPLRDANYVNAYGMDLNSLKADRKSLMQSDALRSLAFILITAGLLWAFLKEKVSQNILLAGLAVLILVDQIPVGKRYLNADNFVKPSQYDDYKNPRDVDRQILKDTDPNFRVHDLSINAFNSSSTSYFHKTIGGYHPAKLQRYQDLIERHIQVEDRMLRQALSNPNPMAEVSPLLANLSVFNMLNTKYFILKEDIAPLPNPNAAGNAWFVDKYNIVNTPNEEINSLRGLNPKATAIVHQEYKDYLNGLNLQKNGNIQLTSYAPNHLTYQSNTTSDQLAVFSEIWYGPDKGWQAYVDGNEVDHIRVNYALRGLRIPSGQHTIEFKFSPQKYKIGKMITLVFSLAILVAFLWMIWRGLQPILTNSGNTPSTPTKSTEPSKKITTKKTTSKRKKKR